MIYRRFGYLQARVLLDKQDQLRVLERDLKDLDEELYDAGKANTETRTNINDDDLQDRRDDLMEEIEKTYCSYGQCGGDLFLLAIF